jgi:uncharacterized FlaG/YvyC family protein
MSNDVNVVSLRDMPINKGSWSVDKVDDKTEHKVGTRNVPAVPTESELVDASASLQDIVNKVSETAVSFSVEQELSRMVVAVRAVGSDEVIRQFPPEEFITVAKFIAAQNPEMISENYLKGILFDQYT